MCPHRPEHIQTITVWKTLLFQQQVKEHRVIRPLQHGGDAGADGRDPVRTPSRFVKVPPRGDISKHAPRIVTIRIPTDSKAEGTGHKAETKPEAGNKVRSQKGGQSIGRPSSIVFVWNPHHPGVA